MRQFEDDMKDREATLQTREAEFLKQIESYQKLDVELQEQEHALIHAREELSGQRERLRSELQCEIEEDRRQLEQIKEELKESRRQLREQIQQNQEEHDDALSRMEQQLNADREALREKMTQEALTEELQRDREEFYREKANWSETREKEAAELKQVRENLMLLMMLL